MPRLHSETHTGPGSNQRRQPMLKHQLGDVAFTRSQRRVLLGNEPGTGKTRSAIEATQGARTLVIAPAMVITSGVWSDELAKWADKPELYTVAPYSKLCARRNGKSVTVMRDEFAGPWDAVIIDEAHYVKGRKTTWTKVTQRLANSAEMLIEMTGTPIPNWAHELYTLLQMLYPHEAGPGGAYGSFWRWAQTWFDCTPTRFSRGMPVVGELLECTRACRDVPASDPCEHYRAFMKGNLGGHYRRVLRDDVLDLPPLSEVSIQIPMVGEQKRIYREMKRDYLASIGGEDIVSWSQGAQNVALDKITTSPWLLNPEGKPRGGKLDRLAFDLAARSSPTLVLAHYRDSVAACAAVADMVGASYRVIHGGTSRAEDAESFAAFKAGAVDVLCASLDKVAEGAQLTSADMVIFVERSFKPYRNKQALYRIHRLGQTRPCVALDYVVPRTVDARKRRMLAVKTDRQMRFLSAGEFANLL